MYLLVKSWPSYGPVASHHQSELALKHVYVYGSFSRDLTYKVGSPNVISSFLNPMNTIVISTINIVIGVVNQLNHLGGPTLYLF